MTKTMNVKYFKNTKFLKFITWSNIKYGQIMKKFLFICKAKLEFFVIDPPFGVYCEVYCAVYFLSFLLNQDTKWIDM
jgi:hypothetical protein